MNCCCGGVARLVHSGTGVDEAGERAEMATLPTSGVSGRRFERDGGRGGVGGAVASWSGARWRRSPCGEPAAALDPCFRKNTSPTRDNRKQS